MRTLPCAARTSALPSMFVAETSPRFEVNAQVHAVGDRTSSVCNAPAVTSTPLPIGDAGGAGIVRVGRSRRGDREAIGRIPDGRCVGVMLPAAIRTFNVAPGESTPMLVEYGLRSEHPAQAAAKRARAEEEGRARAISLSVSSVRSRG